MNKVLFVLFLVCIGNMSCRKGEFAEERYFGKLVIENSPLLTENVDAVFEQQTVGTMTAGIGGRVTKTLPANNKGRLFIYKSGQKQKLADTLITIPKNSEIGFRYLYNESLGINGFLKQVDVPADSVQLQFSYNDLSGQYPAVDVCIWRINGRNYVDDVKIIVRAQTGELNKALITLPCKFIAGGANTTYSIRLKDAVTGNFIANGATMNWQLINTSSACKSFSISAVKINATGTVSVTTTQL